MLFFSGKYIENGIYLGDSSFLINYMVFFYHFQICLNNLDRIWIRNSEKLYSRTWIHFHILVHTKSFKIYNTELINLIDKLLTLCFENCNHLSSFVKYFVLLFYYILFIFYYPILYPALDKSSCSWKGSEPIKFVYLLSHWLFPALWYADDTLLYTANK